MTAQSKSPTAGSFGEVQQIGLEDEPLPADCVATDTMDILPVVTAEHVLPTVALDMLPELRGTCWHRIGLKTACTAMARALLGTEGDERLLALAYQLARAITTSGAVTVLDGKVLVQGDTSIIYTDRALFVMRCSDGG